MNLPTIFISYSHKDEEEKRMLLSHLGVLGHVGLIDVWNDDRIGAGGDWEQEITEAMARARVAILLVSANFLTSHFILRKEVPTLLERREREGLTVFPVIAKACAWKVVPWLTKMNVRPKNGIPVWGDGGVHIDEDLAAIAEEIVDIIKPEGKRTKLEAFTKFLIEADHAVEAKAEETFQHATDELTTLFCDALIFNKLDSPVCLNELHGWLVRVSNPSFQLNVRSEFPVIYTSGTAFSTEDVNTVFGMLDRFHVYDDPFALLIAFNNHQALRLLVRESPYKNDFIVLTRDQLWEIFAAKSPVQRLTNCILEQIDLVKVSPYRVAGPVSEKVFFGRAEEEKTLVQKISQRDYALLANRKMGKTSLLNRIAPILNNIPHYQIFYCDLQAVGDYESFYDELAEAYPEFGQEIADFDKLNPAELSEPTPFDFRKMIRAIKKRNGNRQTILIFDEVDDLLKFDLRFDEKLFKTFRSLSQREKVRFIFSGTTTLVRRMRHPDSPFFNFCEPMKIGLLDEKAARQLVTVPMGTLNVTFENEPAIVERILDITARHPNMLQYTCAQLIRRLNEKGQRTITETDLDLVIASQEFYEYFEGLIWGQATAMEKLIVYLMWNHREFTKRDVIAAFEERDLPTESVEASLEILGIYSILSRKNNAYTFTFSEFAKLMEEHENIEELAADYQQEIRSS
ncbi:TIR domain-containing protein [Candidatus Poribacteria bacterium]|nr:TIR domain-containing protein [Candidatus Poribacteria bacterium]